MVQPIGRDLLKVICICILSKPGPKFQRDQVKFATPEGKIADARLLDSDERPKRSKRKLEEVWADPTPAESAGAGAGAEAGALGKGQGDLEEEEHSASYVSGYDDKGLPIRSTIQVFPPYLVEEIEASIAAEEATKRARKRASYAS